MRQAARLPRVVYVLDDPMDPDLGWHVARSDDEIASYLDAELMCIPAGDSHRLQARILHIPD